MLRALIPIIMLLLSGTSIAQNDKALHAMGSAGIGIVARQAIDNPLAAFAATLAVGAAKEAYDARNGGTGFSGKDMAANLVGAALATLTPEPAFVGFMARSWHVSNDPTKHLTNNTPCALISWDAPGLPWNNGYVDSALCSNSQGFAGAYFGLTKEWRIHPNIYLGAGGGVTWGYRDYKGPLEGIPQIMSKSALLRGCLNMYCYEDTLGKPEWGPLVMLRTRVEIQRTSLLITYMPAKTLAKILGQNQGHWKAADAISIGALWKF